MATSQTTASGTSTRSWQEDVPITDTNLHMLEEGILCDVTFLVGEARSPIRAHKFMLVSRSPVFYAMFCGPLAESPDGIVVSDIDPVLFETFLRYLYTDVCDINDTNVMHMLYVAKKYAATSLVKNCCQFLTNHLATDNVCTILRLALTYTEDALADDCLAYVEKHGEEIMTSEYVTQLDRLALKKVAELDSLQIDEIHIYKACITWAKYQCETSGRDVSSRNVRECLGDILYLVRFPTMAPETLTNVVAVDNILTDSELLSVTTEGSAVFPTSRRLHRGDIISVKRFGGVCLDGWPHDNQTDAVSFSCSRDVWLTGVTLFTPVREGEVEGPLEISDGEQTLHQQNVRMTYSSSKRCEDIVFDRELLIEADTWYTLKQTLQGQHTWSGFYGKMSTAVGSVKVKFFSSSASTSRTSVIIGQFHSLLVKC